MRRHFPHLEVAMNLTQGNNLGWYLPANSDELAGTTREWMNSTEGNDAIGYVESRYYAYIGEFDFVDLRALNADRHRRLPDTIPEPDRTFLALASYNIGRGNLLDATHPELSRCDQISVRLIVQ